MIDIIALIEVVNEHAYAEFEVHAVRIMKQYGGELISAFEPDKKESSPSEVNEIHYLRFPDIESFHAYRNDDELIKLSSLREKAIKKTNIIVAGKYKSYES